jgi:hypothetical protein
MRDPLDTEADQASALAYLFDRRIELDADQPLSLDDQRRVLSIAIRLLLLRIPLPEPLDTEADTREPPPWLTPLFGPQQES